MSFLASEWMHGNTLFCRSFNFHFIGPVSDFKWCLFSKHSVFELDLAVWIIVTCWKCLFTTQLITRTKLNWTQLNDIMYKTKQTKTDFRIDIAERINAENSYTQTAENESDRVFQVFLLRAGTCNEAKITKFKNAIRLFERLLIQCGEYYLLVIFVFLNRFYKQENLTTCGHAWVSCYEKERNTNTRSVLYSLYKVRISFRVEFNVACSSVFKRFTLFTHWTVPVRMALGSTKMSQILTKI